MSGTDLDRDRAEAALGGLVRQFGPGIVTEPLKVKSWLADSEVRSLERSLVLSALSHGVPRDLLAASSVPPLPQLAARMESDAGLRRAEAVWCVAAWARAVGIAVPTGFEAASGATQSQTASPPVQNPAPGPGPNMPSRVGSYISLGAVALVLVVVVARAIPGAATHVEKPAEERPDKGQDQAKVGGEKSAEIGSETSSKSVLKNLRDQGDSIQSTTSMTEERAQRLLNQWLLAQNGRDIEGYKSLYSSNFSGIKRTPSGRTSTYDRPGWIADREKMLTTAKDLVVRIEDMDVRITGDRAVITFVQHYRQDSFSDVGKKEITATIEHGETKIVHEELLWSSNDE